MNVEEFFKAANYKNLEVLCRDFYDKDVTFIDPLGEISGIENLTAYYQHMYRNVKTIDFRYIDKFVRGDEEVFVWQMHLQHKAIAKGDLVIVDGVSILRYEKGKAVYHRDYFDLGTMLYENIPALGPIVRWIKSKAHG